jgi:hypothetical protein
MGAVVPAEVYRGEETRDDMLSPGVKDDAICDGRDPRQSWSVKRVKGGVGHSEMIHCRSIAGTTMLDHNFVPQK